MACKHKFINDLQLQYVDWKPKTLFIGTFNPSWKECENNYADWFYGRVSKNEFWCILPKIHINQSLINGNRKIWIDFCRKNQIAITDIIKSVPNANSEIEAHQKAICKFKDNDLANFEFEINNIPNILEKNKSIKQICITRKTLPPFWENCFQELIEYVHNHPEITLRFLRSPSRGARRGIVGNFCDFIADYWIQQGYEILE